jgi:hypothetical protein
MTVGNECHVSTESDRDKSEEDWPCEKPRHQESVGGAMTPVITVRIATENSLKAGKILAVCVKYAEIAPWPKEGTGCLYCIR